MSSITIIFINSRFTRVAAYILYTQHKILSLAKNKMEINNLQQNPVQKKNNPGIEKRG